MSFIVRLPSSIDILVSSLYLFLVTRDISDAVKIYDGRPMQAMELVNFDVINNGIKLRRNCSSLWVRRAIKNFSFRVVERIVIT